MHNIFVAFATMGFALVPVPEQKDYKQALRDTLKLPTMQFRFDVGLNEEAGFTFSWQNSSTPEEHAHEIESLLASLEGNASDAIRFSTIGYDYNLLKQSDAAAVAWAKAAELYRECLQQDPGDATRLRELGNVLLMLGRTDEAEPLFEKALNEFPDECERYLDLGRCLTASAFKSFFGTIRAFTQTSDCLSQIQVTSNQDDIRRGRLMLDEAARLYDRAVQISPTLISSHTSRAVFYAQREFLHSLRPAEKKDLSKLLISAFLSPDVIDEAAQVVELAPKQYRALGYVAVGIRMLPRLQPLSKGVELVSPIDALSDKKRELFRAATAKLEQLAQDPDPEVQCGALEALIAVELLAADKEVIKPLVQRRLAAGPDNDFVYDALYSVLPWDEVVVVATQSLPEHDTLRNRLMLACAYDEIGKSEEAETHVRIALSRQPDNAVANLALAILTVKNLGDRLPVTRINEALSRISDLIKNEPSDDLILDYTAFCGVLQAIYTDKTVGETTLRQVLAQDSDHRVAKAALEALHR